MPYLVRTTPKRTRGIMETYTVKAHRNGKPTVAYECVICKARLESPLDEAGSVFPCPTCGEQLMTPGTKELGSQRASVERAKQAKEDAAMKLAAASIAKTEAIAPPISKTAGKPTMVVPAPKPMSGGKLFVIISAAVACGITIAVLVYAFFFAAINSASHHSVASSFNNSNLSMTDQAFVDAIDKGDVDTVKEDMLGNINWRQVATPGLVNTLSMTNFHSSEYDSDDQKKAHQFWMQLAERLLQNGADVNIAMSGCYDVAALRFLLAHGANVNSKDSQGCTRLEIYASSGSKYADLYEDCVAFLLANGASVNTTDPDGNTPLHRAAKSNSPKIIGRLIAAGANVNAKNNSGQTPLAIANIAIQSDAITALKANGGME
jgi:predicted RNA-binding Zn-ribbon protein involved in translation (DUF1610 family)